MRWLQRPRVHPRSRGGSRLFSLVVWPLLLGHLFFRGNWNGARADDFEGEDPIVSSIQVEGLEKTKEEIVRRELSFEEGDQINTKGLQETTRKLKNLRLFEDVHVTMEAEKGEARVKVNVKEKWTLIPIVSFGSGGGTAFFNVGAYDINSFGQNLELGTRFTFQNHSVSGTFWTRLPKLTRYPHIALMGEASRAEVSLPWYSQEGDLKTHLKLKKTRVLAMAYWNAWRPFSLGVGGIAETDNPEKETSKWRSLSRETALESTNAPWLRLAAHVNLLNFEGHEYVGHQWESSWDWTRSYWGASRDLMRSEMSWVGFQRLTNHPAVPALLAARVLGFYVSSQTPVHLWKRVGGLEHVRGFYTNQFFGKYGWFGNLEMRVALYQIKSFILQPVTFVDGGEIFRTFERGGPLPLASVGAGLRLIVASVYNLAPRLDFAWPLSPTQQRAFWPSGLNFGFRQFF